MGALLDSALEMLEKNTPEWSFQWVNVGTGSQPPTPTKVAPQ